MAIPGFPLMETSEITKKLLEGFDDAAGLRTLQNPELVTAFMGAVYKKLVELEKEYTGK